MSAAVTVHFLFGALVVARLPKLYLRYGLAAVTKAGALSLALGVSGWAVAAAPWQLFAAALLSGAGWVAMGAAAINAILAPWFARTRPAALAMAYNGASIGGVVFSPLWVAAIGMWGFPAATAVVGVIVTICVWISRMSISPGRHSRWDWRPMATSPQTRQFSARPRRRDRFPA